VAARWKKRKLRVLDSDVPPNSLLYPI